eukprot:6838421-Alexandrium_andersonii.AAC.1
MFTKVRSAFGAMFRTIAMPIRWPMPACARPIMGDYVPIPWCVMLRVTVWLFAEDEAPPGATDRPRLK